MKCDECKNFEAKQVEKPDPWDVEPYDAVYNENIGVTNPLYLQKRRIVKESISGMLFGDFNGEIMGCSHKNNLTPLPPFKLTPLTPERKEQLRKWREEGDESTCPFFGVDKCEETCYVIFPTYESPGTCPCGQFGPAAVFYVVNRLLEQPAVDEAKEFKPYAAVWIGGGDGQGSVAIITSENADGTLCGDYSWLPERHDSFSKAEPQNFVALPTPRAVHAILHKLGFGGNPAPERPVIVKRIERWVDKHIKYFAATGGQTAYVLAEPLQKYIEKQKADAGIDGGDDVEKVLDELERLGDWLRAQYIENCDSMQMVSRTIKRLDAIRAKHGVLTG